MGLQFFTTDPSTSCLRLQALSEKGYVKRMLPSQFKTRGRRTRGMSGAKMRQNDTLSKLVSCKTHDKVLFFR